MSEPTHAAWQQRLAELLPLYGHRNWIVVVDAAYPAQVGSGIDQLFADAPLLDVARGVAAAIDEATHLRAKIHADAELAFVDDNFAEGADDFRARLKNLFWDKIDSVAHEELIARLGRAAESFRVLIIKTPMRIPYTSIFFELDCGYWTAEAEARLRTAMAHA